MPSSAKSIAASKSVLERHPGLHVAYRTMKVKVTKDYDNSGTLEELKAKLRISKDELKDHYAVRALRDFYWKIKIDPTKIRPSSEALARRFLSTGQLPKISNVVDAGNIASVETLVPIGIYDLGKIQGGLTLRFAHEGEVFMDISGSEKILHLQEIVLADELGPIHIFPHRDSLRTRVTEETSEVLIVGCGVEGMGSELTEHAVERVAELIGKVS